MQKARSPAPVMTIARTEGSLAARVHVSTNAVVDLLVERVHALLAVDRGHEDRPVLFDSEALNHGNAQLVAGPPDQAQKPKLRKAR